MMMSKLMIYSGSINTCSAVTVWHNCTGTPPPSWNGPVAPKKPKTPSLWGHCGNKTVGKRLHHYNHASSLSAWCFFRVSSVLLRHKRFVMLNDPSEWSFGCWKSISSLPILGIRTRLNIVIKEQQICLEITNVHVAIVLKSKLLCVCHLGYTFIWNWLFSVAVATILRSLCVFVIIR